MTRHYHPLPGNDYLQRRAAARSVALLNGRSLQQHTPQDQRNAAARREIERRRMIREASQ